MLESYESRSGELLDGQRMFLISSVKLLDAAANRPLRPKFGQNASDLVAVDTLAAKVGTTTLRVLDATAGYNLLHHGGHITDLIVFLGPADIECLIVNQLALRPKNSNERAADIFHMYQRPPWRAVARDQDLARRISETDQIVYYKVGSKAGGKHHKRWSCAGKSG